MDNLQLYEALKETILRDTSHLIGECLLIITFLEDRTLRVTQAHETRRGLPPALPWQR